ncbi:MAG: cell wall hydrolase [Phenylobacterium sp.]|nr:cell wall hydrolase [Phenylobacterium sp.]
MGLGLGAAFLVFGMAGHATQHAHARHLVDAATSGYDGAPVPTSSSSGLGDGFTIYGLNFRADALDGPDAARRPASAQQRRSDLECLTSAVYYEARGESPRGQAAVAQVVLNRVKHRAYPASVCGVVYQGANRKGCQFSFACDGSMRKRREPLAWDRARDVASRALAGVARADIGGATHFHTTSVSPFWAPQMLRVANVGTHVFYRFAPYGAKRAASPAAPVLERAVMTAATHMQMAEMTVNATLEGAISATLDTHEVETKALAAPNDTGKTSPVKAGETKPAKVGDLKVGDAKVGDVKVADGKARVQTARAPDARTKDVKTGESKSKDMKGKTAPTPAEPLTAPTSTEEARLATPQLSGSSAT